jgi:hypothetical protein
MRAYFFTNMYLSSIQNGIQPQHCTSELFVKYDDYGETAYASNVLFDWAKNHKTTIVVNGGYSSTLRELIARFDSQHNPYPWAYFVEDEDAIGPLNPTVDKRAGALTCVGIVLPEKIYETARAIRTYPDIAANLPLMGEWKPDHLEDTVWEISKWEYELCLELNKYGLAS